ncbi:MAG: undecaprenyldiphospho-muramoylpentapeptide beta-N-acetylglucosaminyltransferase [Gammaproteobacteria bacterium]|nr:undecaprenyldiphospho-muramoylpentapeptide beta-N-acetylglucosaminyltransferase [Gammaproteobacteria bacterium]
MTTKTVLIMAGGTGGHVFPALAVADCLKAKNITVVWLGTRQGIEAKLVVEAGYDIRWLSISGLRGKNKWSLVLAPFKLFFACLQALRVIIEVKPAAVLGMGGFASGPGGLMAFLTARPLLVHEQNAIPGMTNTLLAKMAGVVMEAFPKTFKPSDKVHLVGNPVRENIAKIKPPAERLKSRGNRLKILVVGGSLGAAALNEAVPAMLSLSDNQQKYEVWHQAGSKNIATTQAIYSEFNLDARVDAFIDNMADAYEWADVVICRAGAMTVSELAMAGMASILIPYPYAVDDHQTANAGFLVKNNAAILIPQTELSAERLSQELVALTDEKIMKMSVAAQNIATPSAAQKAAELCMLAGGLK